jgi:hypothetical protein
VRKSNNKELLKYQILYSRDAAVDPFAAGNTDRRGEFAERDHLSPAQVGIK